MVVCRQHLDDVFLIFARQSRGSLPFIVEQTPANEKRGDCTRRVPAGAAAADQVPGQVPDPAPERADGGVREAGPVPAGDVRRDT